MPNITFKVKHIQVKPLNSKIVRKLKQKKLVSIMTVITVLVVFITSGVLTLVGSKVSAINSVAVDSASTELSAASDGNIPDPCTLIDVVCENEVQHEAKKQPSKPIKVQMAVSKPIKYKIALEPQIEVKEEPIKAEVKSVLPYKINGTKEQQEKIHYAWEVSGNDKDFLYMLDYENGSSWDVNKLSSIVGANGYRDKGLCQFNIGYHPHIVNNPNFQDYKWQLKECYKAYKGGVKFYGYAHRNKSIKNFIWK